MYYLHGELTNTLTDETLDKMGFQVGSKFLESQTRERVRQQGTLEAIKFVCKAIWMSAFGKSIDKLQTNHKGIFVLRDEKFRFLYAVNLDASVEQKQRFMAFPCGFIRGALSNMGFECAVSAEALELPCVNFHIQLHDFKTGKP